MDASSLLQLFNLSVPTVTSVIAFLIVLVIYQQTGKRSQAGHLKLLMYYFAAMFLDWSIVDIHQTSPHLFVYLNGALYTIALLQTVFFAHFIFIITRTDGRERFSPWNYVFPLGLLAVWIVWSAFVPYGAKLNIIKTYGIGAAEYRAYVMLLVSRLPVIMLCFVGYTVWEAFRLRRYRKNIGGISFPADRRPPKLGWLGVIIGIDFLSIPTNVLSVFWTGPKMDVAMVVCSVTLYVLSQMVLCYNLMLGNYWLVPKVSVKEEINAGTTQDSVNLSQERVQDAVPSLNVNIDRERFEDYVNREKPWLNPEFKITDLANGLGTNRTYVSMFIKSTYGTNFSGYFNGLRLDEFDRLAAYAGKENFTKAEIAAEAGFGTYKSYMRAREQRNGQAK